MHVLVLVQHVLETVPHNSNTIDDHSLKATHDKEHSIRTIDLDLDK